MASFEVEDLGRVVVVTLPKNVTENDSSDLMRALSTLSVRRVILDMSRTRHVNTFLVCFVDRVCRERKVPLKLCGVPDHFGIVLRRFDTPMLQIFRTREEAMKGVSLE